MKIKTIAVDLDQTLLHTDKTVSAYTAAVLRESRARGIRVMAATARPQRDAVRFCERISFDAMVVSNGARILCGDRQTECGISQTSAVHVLDALLRDPDLRITLDTGDCAYSNKPVAEYETVVREDLITVAKAEGVLKILVHKDRAHAEAAVLDALTEDLYATVASGLFIQIMNRAATKWNGIRAVLEYFGESPAETAYFGDDNDDIEPIRRCGMGIAVSNAIAAVREAADDIAESNDSDGVARYIVDRIWSLPE